MKTGRGSPERNNATAKTRKPRRGREGEFSLLFAFPSRSSCLRGRVRLPDGPMGRLLQLHRPVRRVEELFPARVALVGQADVDDRAALGLDRLGNEVHVGLFRGT